MTGPTVLVAQGLSRRFGDILAVTDVSFELARGQSLALIGPNGAGKSTTLSMLTTAQRPDNGHASVDGHDVVLAAQQARASLGVLFQEPALDAAMTPRETLTLHAALHGIAWRETASCVARALNTAGLTDVADVAIHRFSGGMKRRLELARAMMHGPRLLILDEPTLGLDPQGRLDLWSRISALRSGGMAVLMTTHVLFEAESFDRVGILDRGRLVALDTPTALKCRYAGSPDASLEDVFFHLTGRALRDSARPMRPVLVRRQG